VLGRVLGRAYPLGATLAMQANLMEEMGIPAIVTITAFFVLSVIGGHSSADI